jgi:hypothetical protein
MTDDTTGSLETYQGSEVMDRSFCRTAPQLPCLAQSLAHTCSVTICSVELVYNESGLVARR